MSVLKTLMARKKLDGLNKSLEELRAKKEEFAKREEELTQAIAEAETEEEQKAVEESVDALEAEKKENDEATAKLEGEIAELEGEIAETEKKQEESRKAANTSETRNAPVGKGESTMINTRKTKFFGMTYAERDAFFKREDMKNWLDHVRALAKQERAVSGADLLIPDVALDMLRENIENYSLLMSKVRKRTIKGTSKQVISGGISEAVWTEACANINELPARFYRTAFDGHKVAGFIPVCNATLEDSDIALGTELFDIIGYSIGYAVDKAITYGTGVNMPVGIATRICQTSKPSDWGVKDRPWEDLHTSNVVTLASASKAVTLFQELIKASAKAKKKYARGSKIWIMNETTHTNLSAEALTINATGAIVTGLQNTMPVAGGEIIELDFIPDNVIICGYGENYQLIERKEMAFASSEHVRFLEDETIFLGKARYDGKPVIGEAFVLIGLNGVTPDATMTFAADTANASNAS